MHGRTDKLESLAEALGVLNFAREQAQQKAAHVTHPLLCLDAIRAGVEQGGQAGLAAVRLVSECLNSCCHRTADCGLLDVSKPTRLKVGERHSNPTHYMLGGPYREALALLWQQGLRDAALFIQVRSPMRPAVMFKVFTPPFRRSQQCQPVTQGDLLAGLSQGLAIARI